jgi:light-regulated signal transduction histidine kinase (bacteriophytochrome)
VGFSNVLAQELAEALGEDGRRHLSRVSANAQNMGELIEGLLTLSRVIWADVHREPVDLSGLAEQVGRELCEFEPDRKPEFVIHKGLHVNGDRVLSRAALAILVGMHGSSLPSARAPGLRSGRRTLRVAQQSIL